MDSHSWEGQAEGERRSSVVKGYVIVFRNGEISRWTFATNRSASWEKLCSRSKRKTWKKAGARCVPAALVANIP